MCGITGIVDLRHRPDVQLAQAMAAVLRHRGPDEAGSFVDHNCALAMQRLAIQDVLHGHQPAFNEDATIVAVLNGEIYNFRQLRTELLEAGHRLASDSDTEVIPHLYEELGDEFLHRLRGMFALAVWDGERRRLLLARDRLGKKPLYVLRHYGQMRFASEIKAFFADRSVPREPDLESLHHYLCLSYVPSPRTAFAGITALTPGSLLIVDDTGEHRRRWWRLQSPSPVPMSRNEAANEVRSSLQEAVELRMIADVPVGAFLSGGVDSACVVAAMAEASQQPVRTFTIGFADVDHDERARARETALALATEHTEHVVAPDVMGLLPLLAWHYDQPLADDSIVPTFIVARETRDSVTVALNGDGGDEAFAGYPRIQRLARHPGRTRNRALWSAARRLPTLIDPMSPPNRIRRLAARWVGPLSESYRAEIDLFPEQLLPSAYTREMSAYATGLSNNALTAAAIPEDADSLTRVQIADYETYLPGVLLPKVDIATMAVALEARSPLLDHRFVETALRLPRRAKLGPGGSKLALRDGFRGVVPASVLDGPKRGFGLPLETWIRTALAKTVRSLLDERTAAVARIIRPDFTRRLLEEHEAGRALHGSRIFALLVLELWFRTFIDSPPPLSPPAATALSDLS